METLYGLICNEKGMCEKNYLYTKSDLEKYDKQFKEDGYGGTISSNITYFVKPLRTEKEVEKFLCGCLNMCESLNEKVLEDWYYQGMFTCFFTGKENEIMKKWAAKLNVSMDDLQGVDKRVEPFYNYTKRAILNRS